MYITIQKKDLGTYAHMAARFSAKQHTTLPALGSIVIVAGADGIRFRATNLEIGIDCTVPGEIRSEGVVAVPSKIFEEFISSLGGEGTVTLERKGEVLSVNSGKVRSTLKTVPYEDFPTLPFPPKGADSLTLPAATFKGLVDAVLPSASVSTVRPELASVYLYTEGGMMTAVATDSFRLAEKRASIANARDFSALIPAKNAGDLVSALRDDADVTLASAEHQLALYQGGTVVTTRVVSASYPDYRQIIPKESVASATILRKDFEQALKKISVFADAFQKVRVSFETKKKIFSLFAKNPDVGEATEDIPAALTGEQAEVSFNFRYLQGALPALSAESIVITASGTGRATTVRGVGDSSFLYIVMPMNQ
ncbi:MAG: DNA polymerase III subunit beta [Patescibacteria group bacterium]|nr:DNA polymerase III subunit beta [Patescibacteria group bacterium]MDE1966233.1 DNA polymerase III subunit beta [Patescibacteria group bacterium]